MLHRNPTSHEAWPQSSSHMCRSDGYLLSRVGGRRVYFVHSFRATPSPETDDYIAATSDYGGPFVAALQRGNLCATQFHPEKSGAAGLDVLKSFLDGKHAEPLAEPSGNGEIALMVSQCQTASAACMLCCRYLHEDHASTVSCGR